MQDYLKQNEARFVSELCDYVRFASVSAQPKHRQDLQACAEGVVEHCRQIGLQARLCPTKGNPVVVARTPPPHPGPLPLGGGKGGKGARRRRRHFVVYGHYDVQPPEPFELWTSPPFEPRIEGRALEDLRAQGVV